MLGDDFIVIDGFTYSSVMVLHYAKNDANIEMHLCVVAYRLSIIHEAQKYTLGQFSLLFLFWYVHKFWRVAYHEYPKGLVIVPAVIATTSIDPFLQFILIHRGFGSADRALIWSSCREEKRYIVGIHSTIERRGVLAAVMLRRY